MARILSKSLSSFSLRSDGSPRRKEEADTRSSETTMNWTCLVYGAPMLLVLIWWVVSAHKWFTGPRVNLEHMMHGRDKQVAAMRGDDVLEGRACDKDTESSSGSEKGVDIEKHGNEKDVLR